MGICCLSIESSVGNICILAVTGMLKPHIQILSMIFQSAFVALMLTYKGPKCCSIFIFQLESLTEWCWISFEGDETFSHVQTSLLPLKIWWTMFGQHVNLRWASSPIWGSSTKATRERQAKRDTRTPYALWDSNSGNGEREWRGRKTENSTLTWNYKFLQVFLTFILRILYL